MFGRAWAPLSTIIGEDPNAVTWMPAHCSHKDIGVRRIGDGQLYSSVDFVGNDTVDMTAKAQAKKYAPTQSECKYIWALPSSSLT